MNISIKGTVTFLFFLISSYFSFGQNVDLENTKMIRWKDVNGNWRGQIMATGNLFSVTPMGTGQALRFGDGTSSASDTWFGNISGTSAPTNVPFIVKSSGLIGIGTNTPTEPLHIQDGSGYFTFGRPGTEMNNRFTLNSTSGYENQIYFRSGHGRIFANSGYNLTFGISSSANSLVVAGNTGFVGVGTNSPDARLHVESGATEFSSTSKTGATLIVQGTGLSRNINEGAAIGFIVPANTDGSNHWQQGRILVTPDNESNANASGRMYLQTRHYASGEWRWRNNLVLLSTGSVGIGTTTTGTHKLAVEGTIGAREIKVEASGWSDFVFEENYALPTLSEVESHIREKGHLKDIPSTEEVKEKGIYLGEMDAKLLQKIEELTLYMIAMNKRMNNQNEEIQLLKSENKELKAHIRD